LHSYLLADVVRLGTDQLCYGSTDFNSNLIDVTVNQNLSKGRDGGGRDLIHGAVAEGNQPAAND
jgi:hypothetical protein